MNEHLENIRRMAERGIKVALTDGETHFVDYFQHILDEYERAKEIDKDKK